MCCVFYNMLDNGSMGVFIFFLISGYLITTLLLREQEKTSRISLKSFYVRKALRRWAAWRTLGQECPVNSRQCVCPCQHEFP